MGKGLRAVTRTGATVFPVHLLHSLQMEGGEEEEKAEGTDRDEMEAQEEGLSIQEGHLMEDHRHKTTLHPRQT